MSPNSSADFSTDVNTVIARRLTMLPFLWMTDPKRAEKETRKMFSEKEDALQDMQQQLFVAPMMFWADLWQGALRGDNDGGLQYAFDAAEKRVSAPYVSRVNANLKRLSKGK